MNSKLLAFSALALLLSAGAASASPTATITDAGTGNTGVITQAAGVSGATEAAIHQLAPTNGGFATITQSGVGQETGLISQTHGTNNSATINQVDNSLTIDEVDPSSDYYQSVVNIRQTGSGNSSTATQNGDNNPALIWQGYNYGRWIKASNGSFANITQIGNGNIEYIHQFGSVHTASIAQAGNGNRGNTYQQLGSGDVTWRANRPAIR